MRYLDKTTDVSDKIYLRVIQTFMEYEKYTNEIFPFINLSHTLIEECNINFNDIYKMITKNFLKELLKDELKKAKQKKCSNWNKEIDTVIIDYEDLKHSLSTLIFTNFESFKEYIWEFEYYIQNSGITTNYYIIDNPKYVDIKFKDFFLK